MSSKRRLRRRACESKRRYDTAYEAYSARRSVQSRNEKVRGYTTRMNVYKCKFCGGYHTGHVG